VTAPDAGAELVPLRTGFDLVWRGYDRDQVQGYVRSAEAELRLLSADRDAAVAQAEGLARELADARVQIRRLSERLDRICRTPVEADALTEWLRRMAELAHAEAAEILARAHAAADHTLAAARDAADQLRRQHERLLGDAESRRREMETEHRELMRRAHEQVRTAARQDAQRRRQVESDFQVAMAARRADALREIQERQAAARREAERLIADARTNAERIVREARRQVDQLAQRRDQLAAALQTTLRLLTDAAALLAPLPDEDPGRSTTEVNRCRDDGGAAA
jgi:cell division septum initiation protein DivIVA